RAWMAGVASNNGKFHEQQAKRLRAETAQREEEEDDTFENIMENSHTHTGFLAFFSFTVEACDILIA
ncbi:jg3889, partial [Pararge aegeria aegeria]